MSEDKVESRFELGVIVVKRRLKGPWASHAWLPSAVLPAAPAMAPWTRLGGDDEEEVFYAGSVELALNPGGTSHYRDNLVSGRPSLWVALRPIGGEYHEVSAVTADPYEGEALAEGIGEIVEAVPMPAEIQDKVAAYFAAFHVERVFLKRERDKVLPAARGRDGPGRREEGE